MRFAGVDLKQLNERVGQIVDVHEFAAQCVSVPENDVGAARERFPLFVNRRDSQRGANKIL